MIKQFVYAHCGSCNLPGPFTIKLMGYTHPTSWFEKPKEIIESSDPQRGSSTFEASNGFYETYYSLHRYHGKILSSS